MTEEEEAKFAEAYEKHKAYRRSGLALMTTVITLSTGGMVGLKATGVRRGPAGLLFAVIAMALVQQLLNYLAETQEARGNSAWLIISRLNNAAANPHLPPAARENAVATAQDNLKSAFSRHTWADRFYRWADALCIIVVICFLAVGAWVVYHLPLVEASGQ